MDWYVDRPVGLVDVYGVFFRILGVQFRSSSIYATQLHEIKWNHILERSSQRCDPPHITTWARISIMSSNFRACLWQYRILWLSLFEIIQLNCNRLKWQQHHECLYSRKESYGEILYQYIKALRDTLLTTDLTTKVVGLASSSSQKCHI